MRELNRTAPGILVVEDSNTDVFLIREALETAGVNAHVHVVVDGHAAIKLHRAMLMTLYSTGMRRAELCQRRLNSVRTL